MSKPNPCFDNMVLITDYISQTIEILMGKHNKICSKLQLLSFSLWAAYGHSCVKRSKLR